MAPGANVGAAGLPLEIHLHDEVDEPVAVVVEQQSVEAPPKTLLQVTAAAPGSVQLREASPPWLVRAEAVGYWSEPLIVADVEQQELDLHLWPAALLRAKLTVPRGHSLPPSIAVRVQQEQSSEKPVSPRIEATVLCPVETAGRIECRLPAVANLDLRLRAPGFASRFYWGLDLSATSPLDLGAVPLRPGASVVGTVDLPAGFAAEDVVARLAPATASPFATGDGRRVERQSALEARPNLRGVFAFEGLSPGSYRLEVRHPDLAPYDFQPIRVVDGRQTELTETIVLHPPSPLRLVLDPPFDPYGGDWRLELFRRLGPERLVRATAEQIAASGLLEVVLAPGEYAVEVRDSRGARLKSETVTIDPRGTTHVLGVDTVFVDGLVSLGDEPLLARVTFRGETTREMDTDVEGRFTGYLPRAGEWDVAVHAFEPPVNRRTRAVRVEVDEDEDRAFVHLRLPDTSLRGRVVDEGGVPFADARVTITDPLLTSREVTVTSDERGEILVRGLDEGNVQVQAVYDLAGELWSSRPEVAELREETTAEVRLVLRAHGALRGRVVAAGNPLPGVWLEAQPFDGAGVLDAPAAQPYATDDSGRFDLSLPRSTGEVHLSILAPGHPLTQVVSQLGDLADVELGTAGGTLQVELPVPIEEVPWADPTKPRPGLVDGRGVKLPVSLLVRWAELNGGSWSPVDTRLSIPLLSPGRYAVCWISPADWLVRSATGSRCAAGELTAGGMLTLRLPPAGSPSARP